MVLAELLTCPAEAAAHLLHVAVRRNENTPTGDDHLYDHAGYRVGKLPVDYALYLPGTLHIAGRAVAAERATVAIGGRHVQESRSKRLVEIPALRLTGCRQSPERVAVIISVAGDELVSSGLAVQHMILAGYLEGGLVRLRPGVGVPDHVLAVQPLVELLPQLDSWQVTLTHRVIGHGLQLLVGDSRQLFPAVADIDAPHTGHAVEISVTVEVRYPGPVGPH